MLRIFLEDRGNALQVVGAGGGEESPCDVS